MKLWDMLNVCEYYQPISVYITNAYDQNLLIGRGTRPEIVNEDNTTVFDHLMDEVEMWRIRDNRMIIFIRDNNYNKQVDELFCHSEKWGDAPEERPWRYIIETEVHTDKYIKVVHA